MTSSEFTLDFFSLEGSAPSSPAATPASGRRSRSRSRRAAPTSSCRASLDDDGATGRLIEAEGVRHASMQVDITEPGAPRRVVDACVEQLGSVDILINSAGIAPLGERARVRAPDLGRHRRRQPHRRVRDELRGGAADGAPAQRQDHQHLLRLLVPRRPAGAGLRGHEARHRGADEDLLRRARAAQHPGQRDRARLLRDRAHGGDAERPRARTSACSITSRPAAGASRST